MRRMNATARNPAAEPRGGRKAIVRRRPAPPRWRRTAWRFGLAGTMLLAVSAGAYWFRHSAIPSEVEQRYAKAVADLGTAAGFRLQRITVDGRVFTPREDLLAALDLSLGEPMLEIDPAALKQRIEKLGWVRSAAVDRRLPGEIHIQLTEAVPAAIWQSSGHFQVIDRAGHLIGEAAPKNFVQLPVLAGDRAPQHADALFTMLAAEPDLASRVRAAVWVGDRRWNLRFDNGVDVKLPADSPQAAWSMLAKLEREQRLLARDITVIDMRLPDRLVVRMGPAAELRQPGSET
jgi:cell division protein FtsQ